MVFKNIKKVVSKVKRFQAEKEARELQSLRTERLKLEGKARLAKLKKKEQGKIAKARKIVGPKQPGLFGLTVPQEKEMPSLTESFSFDNKNKKGKKKEEYWGF